MNKRIKISLTLFFCAILYINSNAQMSQADPNAKIKAIFIYNFTKYIEWPSSAKQGDFVIGVFGKTNITAELEKMALLKKAGNQTIVIKQLSSVNEITNCQMLFIAADKSSQIGNVMNKIKNNSILIVSEDPGMAKKGSAINFVPTGNKLTFELNRTAAQKHELNVSSSLNQLAILVD
ncbi:MAG: YfiR family protein [Cytophagales bacterium]|nr:YfiR family protein [Cytophagales bacterium]